MHCNIYVSHRSRWYKMWSYSLDQYKMEVSLNICPNYGEDGFEEWSLVKFKQIKTMYPDAILRLVLIDNDNEIKITEDI